MRARWSLPGCVVLALLSLSACDDPGETVGFSIERERDAVGVDAAIDAQPDAPPDAELPDEIEVADTDAPETIDEPDTADAEVPDQIDTSDADGSDAPDAPDLAHPDPEWPTLAPATLAAIDVEMTDTLDVPGLAGRTFGGIVVDLETDQVLWEEDADRLMIPASNTKVFTTAAAFELLGPEHRMLTRVFGGAIAGGVLDGDLGLHSEHDFTWSRWFYADPSEPPARLADALWHAGLRRVTGGLAVFGAYLYEGYHFGTYDPATQRARAGQAFLAALAARGIAVDGGLVDNATMALPAGAELARWTSIPLHVGAWAINRRSHNEMADILARHVGWIEGGSSDYVTGGAVIADWLASTGVDATGFFLGDGSGLDLANRVSARQLAAVYQVMARSSGWEAWRSSLSVAGAGGPASVDGDDVAIVTTNTAPFNGTLASRMSGADTAGRVFGKSGTNAGITTSGVIYQRWNGRRYAFAFQMNQVPDYNLARVTQDALAAVVAKRRGEPERPAAPTLGCAHVRSDGLVEVSVLSPPPTGERAGFSLETSRDGVVFARAEALFAATSPFVLQPPPSNQTLYVRARAETSAGVSDPSDVYAVRAGAARVLLIDANDRWQRQPTNENPMGAPHAFMVAYAAAVPPAMAVDTCPNEALLMDGPDAVALAAYDAVVWSTGEEAASDESVSTAEGALLTAYLGLGGGLFLSGAEVAWDLDPAGNPAASAADRALFASLTGATYASDDGGSFVAEGVPGGIFADLDHERRLGFWNPGGIFVAWPDALTPAGAEACLVYRTTGAVAAVQSSEPAVVTFGFPFESIDAAAERALVMERVLEHLGL